MFTPKLVSTLKGYTRKDLTADLVAGTIVGIVALPLAIAFAIASGVTPDKGLYTAIIAGFLISALGGSRVQIGGPTGAFVVIVYGIVQQHGIDGLIIATIMAGALLVVMGFAKLGAILKFIPHAVVVGFTSGIAVIIAVGQIKDLLGLEMGDVPADFIEKWVAYAEHIGSVSPMAVLVSVFTLGVVLFWPRINRRVPAPFVALVVTTVLVHLFAIPVETVGSRFGTINASFPRPDLPPISIEKITSLIGPAFTIAILAAVESLLSAVVADGMIGGRHRSNMELVAQGVANIVTPIFGGIPATGAIARTATNIKSGGRTPIAGITHAVVLLLITLFFGRLAGLIPMAALAAILVVVAYHMSEWRTFKAEFRAPKSDLLVMLSTFTLTVVVDLTVAIQVGMVMAAFLFMRRMAEVTNVSMVTRELQDNGDPYMTDPNAVRRRSVPDGVEVYEINGPFFFGAAEKFKSVVGRLDRSPRVFVIRMRNVMAMDSTGLHALKDLVHRSRRAGSFVILSDVHTQPLIAMERSGLLEEIGVENAFGNIDDALNRAREYLGEPRVEPPEFAQPTVARESAPARDDAT